MVLRRGDILRNRYTVKKIIKPGEKSNIYLVEDSHLMKEWVLKEFTIEVENPHLLKTSFKKFERQVALLAGLKHPGIPEFVDHFVLDNTQYLVMEYVPGKSLADVLEETFHPMYEPDVLKIGIQLAGTLHYLHKQSSPIIFRDLKPSNIMITPDFKVKLIDFNLGRYFTHFKDIRRKKSGTPGYAPPEQIGRDVYNEQTDIYALGAILHQLITLRDPTDLPNVFKFPTPSSINVRVSGELDKIITRATAYKAADRYFSVLEMKRELEALLKQWEVKNQGRPAKKGFSKESAGKRHRVKFATPPGLESLDEKTPSKIGSFTRKTITRYIVAAVVLILVIFAGVQVYRLVTSGQNQRIKNTVESPFANVRNKRILKYREKGIELYKKGSSSGDTAQLASAVNYLTKVVSAHPTDVESQVYLQNLYVLLKKQPHARVAVILSLSGDDFESGSQILAGVALAQSLHNKKGEGLPLLVEIFDDKSSLEEAIKIAVKLSKRKDLLAVIGPIRSPFLFNTSAFFEEAKIVQIAPTAVCADKENLGDYIFRIAGNGKNLGIYMAKFAVDELGLKRLALVYDPAQSYSKPVGDVFRKTVEEMGKATVETFEVSLDSMDYSDAIEELKKFHPDGVFFVAYQMHQAKFARQLKEAGVKTVHLATSAAYSDQLINLGGRAVEGLIFDTYFFPGLGTDTAGKFVKLYREKYDGVDPNFRSALAYDSVLVVSRALERGIKTPEELKRFIREVLGKEVKLSGSTGSLSCDKYGRRENANLIPLTVKHGKFVLYKKK